MTNDGATILKSLYVDNPAAKVLVGALPPPLPPPPLLQLPCGRSRVAPERCRTRLGAQLQRKRKDGLPGMGSMRLLGRSAGAAWSGEMKFSHSGMPCEVPEPRGCSRRRPSIPPAGLSAACVSSCRRGRPWSSPSRSPSPARADGDQPRPIEQTPTADLLPFCLRVLSVPGGADERMR